MAAAEENARDRRFRRAVPNLGLHFISASVSRSNDSTIFDGRSAIRIGGQNHVVRCLVTGNRRLELEEWRTSLIIGACLLLGGKWRVTISEKNISTRALGGTDRGDRSHLLVLVGMVTGMAPRPTAVCGWELAGGFPGASGLCSEPGLHVHSTAGRKSSNWNIDPARHEFHLVRQVRFIRESRKHAPRRFLTACSTNGLWRNLLLLAGIIKGELPRFSSRFRLLLSLVHSFTLVLIGAVVGTLRYIWPAASLRSGEGGHLRVLNPSSPFCLVLSLRVKR